jgi:uncharacterized membrane protein YphA (DoxX/SURF4 family)
MNNLTRVFLVLLRLAIGWHFFFEGWEKFDSLRTGPTTTNRPFTSASYLKEATGPFADFFRNQAGDTDEAVLERLTVVPLPSGQDSAQLSPHTRMPPRLVQEWHAYLASFIDHYHLDRQQAALAEKKLEQREDSTVHWLLEGGKKVKKSFPTGTVEVEETTVQRVQDYRDKIAEVNEMQSKLLKALGKDVLHEKLKIAKAELNQIRMGLLADLNEQTEFAKTALEDVLTPEQKQQGQALEAQQASEKMILPLTTVDYVVTYGLMAIGACLLLGLFSRSACVAGAVFLLLLYLAMPPFPWLPDPPRPTEGHYLFVSKNLIEMIALLALATTRSGCWAGLDGLVQFLNPWRGRSSQESGVRYQESGIKADRLLTVDS